MWNSSQLTDRIIRQVKFAIVGSQSHNAVFAIGRSAQQVLDLNRSPPLFLLIANAASSISDCQLDLMVVKRIHCNARRSGESVRTALQYLSEYLGHEKTLLIRAWNRTWIDAGPLRPLWCSFPVCTGQYRPLERRDRLAGQLRCCINLKWARIIK